MTQVDILAGGAPALKLANVELGLALADDEIDYLVASFEELQRFGLRASPGARWKGRKDQQREGRVHERARLAVARGATEAELRAETLRQGGTA